MLLVFATAAVNPSDDNAVAFPKRVFDAGNVSLKVCCLKTLVFVYTVYNPAPLSSAHTKSLLDNVTGITEFNSSMLLTLTVGSS